MRRELLGRIVVSKKEKNDVAFFPDFALAFRDDDSKERRTQAF